MAFFFAQSPSSLICPGLESTVLQKGGLYAQYPPYSQEWIAQQLLVANLSIQNINISNLIRAIRSAKGIPQIAPSTANSIAVEPTPSLLGSEQSCSNKIRFSLLQAAKNVNEAIKQIIFAQAFPAPSQSMAQEQVTERLEQNEAQGYVSDRLGENSLLRARNRDQAQYQEPGISFFTQGSNQRLREEEKGENLFKYGDSLYFNNQQRPRLISDSVTNRQIRRFALSRLPAIYQPQRLRKNKSQLAILKRELTENPEKWSKERIKVLADQTGLGKDQVYKWWWDQTSRKKKEP